MMRETPYPVRPKQMAYWESRDHLRPAFLWVNAQADASQKPMRIPEGIATLGRNLCWRESRKPEISAGHPLHTCP